MKKIKWTLGTGFAGCKCEGEFEVDEEIKDDEIGEMVKEQAYNNLDLNWWCEDNE